MALVIQSSNTATLSGVSSITITKPTGLAVGDLLLFIGGNYDAAANNRSHTTPSGWTVIQKQASGDYRPVAYYIVATATEVAASNFTFAMSGATTALSGYLARITGQTTGTPVVVSEMDVGAVEAVGTITYTTNITPDSGESLVFNSFAAASTSMVANPATISTYVSVPALSWTEVADLGIKNGSSDGHVFSVAHASATPSTTITSRSATVSESLAQGHSGICLVVKGIFDTTGTNALHSVSPTHFAQAGVAGTTGTNVLLEPIPDIFSQSGRGETPAVWTPEVKTATTWTPELK